MIPIIGILPEVDNERESKLVETYVRAVEHVGGVPIILPYTDDTVTIGRYIDLCDGFILSGGCDVDPCHYGEPPSGLCGEIQPYRDELEFKLLDALIGGKQPLLAICRGIQVLNVALGGTLWQDIPSECPSQIRHSQSEPKMKPSHSVTVLPGTPLYELTGKRELVANSFHHQAIKRLGVGLKIMARATDGTVEGVYLEGAQYVRGYQWHPERLVFSDGDNEAIFRDFVLAAAKAKQT